MSEINFNTNRKKAQNKKILYIFSFAIAISVCLFVINFIFISSEQTKWSGVEGQDLLKEFDQIASQETINEIPTQLKDVEKAAKYLKADVNTYLDNIAISYENNEISFQTATNKLNNYKLLSSIKKQTSDIEQTLLTLNDSKMQQFYNEAIELSNKENYLNALLLLSDIAKNNKSYVEEANALKADLIVKAAGDINTKVGWLLSNYKIAEANELVKNLVEQFPEEHFLTDTQQYINNYEAFQTNLVEYNGPVEHVFTHCLIAFPEICYAGNSMTTALDTDCITPYELTKILQSLYEKDYILIDINTLISENNDGTVSINTLMLPKDKKPLIFSIDDVVYDARKMHTGMVDKLIIGENGRIATYTKHATGEEVISYDNEIFPIIESFCAENPYFTFQGTKGTLALTGFQGILGYRTQYDAPEGTDIEKEKELALSIIAQLKENGWNFASHSYKHGHMREGMSYDNVADDTMKWDRDVETLVGDSKVLIFPYGETVRNDDPKFNVLYNSGFRIFCNVGSVGPYLKSSADKRGVYQDRRSLDGYSLRNFNKHLLPLFDTTEVIDPIRNTMN